MLNFGRASVKAKKYNDAVDALETAVELAPDFPEIRYELCLAYVWVGNEAGASKELATLKELDPRLAMIW